MTFKKILIISIDYLVLILPNITNIKKDNIKNISIIFNSFNDNRFCRFIRSTNNDKRRITDKNEYQISSIRLEHLVD